MATKQKLEKTSVQQAIRAAERVLPGVTATDDEYNDPRWQAIIAIGEYVETEPNEVWSFIRKWGKHPSDDLRMAIATCLLEHLLEYHFDEYFPLVRKMCKQSKRFADTFQCCWPFGQTEEPEKLKAFKALQSELD